MSADKKITLEQLLVEIDQHVPRIKNRATAASPSGVQSTSNTAMLELSGTVLPIVRDLVAYVAQLEGAMIQASDQLFDRVEAVEEDMAAASEASSSTQFDPEDAEKFTEFLKATKLILESLAKEAANPEPVRKKISEMVGIADELLAIVEENTLEVDSDEEDEDQGEEEEDDGSSGGAA